MTANDRREAISRLLNQSEDPVSATALAHDLGVSRQIIVGDIALLRAAGAEIASTPRGYRLPRDPGGLTATLVCRHSAADLERELYLMVDNGCTCVNVSVEHPVYGQLSGQLQLSSRYDVREFIRKVNEQSAALLSVLTGGIHLHRIQAPTEAVLERVRAALRDAGFLVE